MQQRNYYIVATWVLVVGAVSAGIAYVTEPRASRESSELVSPKYIDEPVAQRQSTRDWRLVNWAEIRSIGDVRVNRPVIMKISHRGDAYVLDWLDLKIHVYTDRDEARTIGAGRGFGPGELQNPTDFVVEPDGGVWICDPAENRLTHFGPTGILQATISLPDRSDRMLSTPTGVVLKLSPGNPNVFGLLNESGAISQSWGEILRNKSDHGLVLDGTFASFDRQPKEVVFVSHSGSFLAVSKGNRITLLRALIDGSQLPDLVHTAQRWKVGPNNRQVLSSGAAESAIFVLLRKAGTANDAPVIDAYRRETGEYMWSATAPVQEGLFAMTGSLLASLSGRDLRVWRFGIRQ